MGSAGRQIAEGYQQDRTQSMGTQTIGTQTIGTPGIGTRGAMVSGGRYAGPVALAPSKDNGQQFSRLAFAVAQDVVPRLNLPPGAPWHAERGTRRDLPPSAILRFAALALESDLAGAFAVTDGLRARGMPVETIFLELLAPAARQLGTLWSDDDCTFTQVTIGVGVLHHVLRALAPALTLPLASGVADRTALLIPLPGEQHSFGLAMVSEFFVSGGWSVSGGTPSLAELVALVRRTSFAVVGFSLGSETRLDTLREAVGMVRDASRNRDIGVLVGGPVFLDHPELAAQVGADATAADGRLAVRQAEGFLRAIAVRG